MNILARLRRLRTSLADTMSDYKSSQNIGSPEDVLGTPKETPEEGIPSEPPSEGTPSPEDINLGDEGLAVTDDDIPKIEEPAEAPVPEVPEEPQEGIPEPPEGSDVADIPPDPTEIEGGTPEEEEKPRERNWEPITPPDNDMKSLSFKSDKEGIFLDMKRLDVAHGLWIARLYKDGKILDFGQVVIPKNINDPITYILELANAMLDSRSMRYEQEWRAFYDNKRKAVSRSNRRSRLREPSPESTEEKESEGMVNTLFGEEPVSKPGEEPEEEVDLGSLFG